MLGARILNGARLAVRREQERAQGLTAPPTPVVRRKGSAMTFRMTAMLPIGLVVAAMMTGCGTSIDEGQSNDGTTSEWSDLNSGSEDLGEIVDTLAAGCESAGGSQSSCECIAEWLVMNTSPDDLAFASDAPADGKWIYFGGDVWIPYEYAHVFEDCGA